jgi:uncharacterized protein YaiI (UPF0178 family)
MEVCPATDGAADDRIVALAVAGDIAVTRDVGLAKRLVAKGVDAIDDRGRRFTPDTINEYYSLRCFQVGLAENGIAIVRTASYGAKALKAFADAFNALLDKRCREERARA